MRITGYLGCDAVGSSCEMLTIKARTSQSHHTVWVVLRETTVTDYERSDPRATLVRYSTPGRPVQRTHRCLCERTPLTGVAF